MARRGGDGTVAALLRFFSSFTICNSAETSVAAGGVAVLLQDRATELRTAGRKMVVARRAAVDGGGTGADSWWWREDGRTRALMDA